jgi:hypothetical protein
MPPLQLAGSGISRCSPASWRAPSGEPFFWRSATRWRRRASAPASGKRPLLVHQQGQVPRQGERGVLCRHAAAGLSALGGFLRSAPEPIERSLTDSRALGQPHGLGTGRAKRGVGAGARSRKAGVGCDGDAAAVGHGPSRVLASCGRRGGSDLPRAHNVDGPKEPMTAARTHGVKPPEVHVGRAK